ncbi:MAG: MCE family protein [Candidatus Omnitrophica bacterium]|nr:MCE family protein [Candidatus Omnitrophota bacterium]
MSNRKSPDQTIVGFFVIIGFILLSLVVFFISGVYLFRPGYSVNVMYDYVSILDKGAPIRLAGVRIGEVNQVDLLYDTTSQKTRVKIKLFIEKGVEIRKNYKFKIQGTHVLSEPHIEITPEPGNSPLLEDGVTLEGENLVPIEAFIERAQKIAENIEAMTTTFKNILSDKESGKTVKQIIVNLGKITDSLQQALNGKEGNLGQTIANLDKATESLKEILDHVKQGEGTVGALLKKDELYQDMRSFVSDIKTHPWRLFKKG